MILASPVLASDISGAIYRGSISVTNSSYTATEVAVPFALGTGSLISGYYVNSDLTNTAIRDSGGVDVPYMPAVSGSTDWMLYAGQVSQNSSKNYSLYTGGSTDMAGDIVYFPGDTGMTADDDASLELGNNFIIEQEGYINTDASSDKNLVYKEGAFRSYVSGDNEITSSIYGLGAEAETESHTDIEADVAADTVFTSFSSSTTDEDFSGTTWLAQSFTLSSPAIITDVALYIEKNGAPPDADIKIGKYYNNYGNISMTGIGTFTGALDTSEVSTSQTWVTFDLGLAYGWCLEAGTYAIILENTDGDTANELEWCYSSSGYSGGEGVISTNSGSNWSLSSKDYGFQVIGYLCTPVSSSYWGLQPFTPDVNTSLTEIDLYMKEVGSAGTITLNLYEADASHEPTGASLASASLGSADIGSTYDWETFDLSSPVDIDTETEYCFVLSLASGTYYLGWADGNADVDYSVSSDSGSTWSNYSHIPDGQLAFKLTGQSMGELVNVTATGIDSGEHTVKTTADGTDLKIYVDDVLKDTDSLGGASVPNNSNSWTFASGGSVLYLRSHDITIGGILKQYIEWQNSSTFEDSTAYGNDCTPSFRTTTTDADVSATLNDYEPFSMAEFSGSSDDDTVTVIDTAPTMPTEMYREMETEHLPGADLINEMLTEADIPLSLFWFPWCFISSALLGMLIYAFTRSLFALSATTGMGLTFYSLAGPIPFWVVGIFAIIAIAILIKQGTASY